jgi:hypothetical protein
MEQHGKSPRVVGDAGTEEGVRMPSPVSDDVDRLRDAFRTAWVEYTRQGEQMKDLLIALEELPQDERMQVLSEQQVSLTNAHQRYEEARCAYVSAVLGGGSVPTKAPI